MTTRSATARSMRWLRLKGAAAGLALAIQGCLAAGAAELVMYEQPGCAYCARWRAEVEPGYLNAPEARRAPLVHRDIRDGAPAGARLAQPVRFTPTFVLFDRGQELGRITGYIDNATFWGLLGDLLHRLDRAPDPASPVTPLKDALQ